MHYLCSLSFEEPHMANTVKLWLNEDILLLKENRNHYIINMLRKDIDIDPKQDWLKELSEVRHNYNNLSDDDGPYHVEVFPYHYVSPEDALLNQKDKMKFSRDRINSAVEELIVAISISNWG